jgi:hypothetical protein
MARIRGNTKEDCPAPAAAVGEDGGFGNYAREPAGMAHAADIDALGMLPELAEGRCYLRGARRASANERSSR